jgi:hypothetical protein
MLFMMLTLVGCHGSRPEPIRHADRLSMWSEFVDADSVESRMAQAAELGVNVNLAIKAGEVDILAPGCEAAAAHDVQLMLWPLLSEEDGYWPNQGNASAYRAFVNELLGKVSHDCPQLFGVAVDMEPPLQTMDALTAPNADIVEMVSMLVDGIDEQAFASGRETMASVCADIQAAGLHCRLTTLPMLVDDLADGDEGIAKALHIPIRDVGWDSLGFQVYRSLFETYALDEDAVFTSGLVASYVADIKGEWGGRAAIDLGTTGGGMVEHGGLDSAEQMQADIAAALYGGVDIGRISVYSLEGLDDYADASDWVVIPSPTASVPTSATTDVRTLIQTLDLAVE